MGGLGEDTLEGGSGDDVLDNGPGSDVLLFGIGEDVYNGGDGTDTVSARQAPAAIVVDTGTGTIGGTAGVGRLVGVERVEGSEQDDTFALGGDALALAEVAGAGGTNTVSLQQARGQVLVDTGSGMISGQGFATRALQVVRSRILQANLGLPNPTR